VTSLFGTGNGTVTGQVLDVAEKPGDVSHQQHAFNRQSAAAAVSVHRHLRPARNADIRWQVRLGRHRPGAASQLRYVLPGDAHRLPGR